MPRLVSAAEGVDGVWEFKSQIPGRTSSATMAITKNAEGKYEGTWSSQWGESSLSDITFDNGKLTFVQTVSFGDREMKTTYEGKVEGVKLAGKGKGQWGEFTFDGTLQPGVKPDANDVVGEWQIAVTIQPRDIVEKMTITKNADGSLSGKWQAQRGESTISDVNFAAGKLTFTRTSKMGPMEFTSTFDGAVQGDTIKGVFKSERGDREITAARVAPPKPDEGQKTEPNKPAEK